MKWKLVLLLGAFGLVGTACGDDDDPGNGGGGDGNGDATLTPAELSAGTYRDDLDAHVGCVPKAVPYTGTNAEPFSIDNTANVPSGDQASITGYPCAAKEYDQDSEDTELPIVVLVHGNSSGPTTWEEYGRGDIAGTEITTGFGFPFTVDSDVREMLASKLVNLGYRVIAFDARVDLVATEDGFNADQATGNAFQNIDHGWAVPMLQSLIRAVMTNNANREVSLIGHSLGATVIRDALRRLYNESVAGTAGAVNPFTQLQDVVLLSGANKGVRRGGELCNLFPGQMSGTVTCEMGDLLAFQPTYFTRANNGPDELYTTPCADGDFAFGDTDACGDNVVEYTTITMDDFEGENFRDEFINEDSSRLNNDGCIDNVIVSLDAFDSSGYYFLTTNGFFANHFGSARSDIGMDRILDALSTDRTEADATACAATVAEKVAANDLSAFDGQDASEMIRNE
ncbi:MAG: alpha/beta hydrolase [Myxococcota bacterium]